MSEQDDISLFDEVKALIADKLSVDKVDIMPESKFSDDLEADSLDLIELVMAIEDKYDIKIADEDAEKIGSLNDAVQFIEEALGKEVKLED